MKKKIDISLVASTLRGESVFFPEKNGKPVPAQAGEPLENSDLAPKHQVTKAPEFQSDRAPSNQTTKDTKQESTKTPADLSTKAGSNPTANAPTVQSTKVLRHFSSYLRPETYKAWKLLATQREVKDYDVLQEALAHYLEQNST